MQSDQKASADATVRIIQVLTALSFCLFMSQAANCSKVTDKVNSDCEIHYSQYLLANLLPVVKWPRDFQLTLWASWVQCCLNLGSGLYLVFQSRLEENSVSYHCPLDEGEKYAGLVCFWLCAFSGVPEHRCWKALWSRIQSYQRFPFLSLVWVSRPALDDLPFDGS